MSLNEALTLLWFHGLGERLRGVGVPSVARGYAGMTAFMPDVYALLGFNSFALQLS